MDIDRFNFWEQLPVILQAICDSRYVAVDLEMSGINADHFSHLEPTSTKPTLQQEYKRARAAAEMYTILQFGLTCINWDHDRKSYVTKTFNITLHPGVPVSGHHSLDFSRNLDRCFSVSNKSLDFLEAHGFKFSDVFKKGVPFLSVAEYSSERVSRFMRPSNRCPDTPFDVADLPQASMEFYNELREGISTWRAQMLSGACPEPLRVDSPSGHEHRLNSLQKRLVRQLVRARFPDLTAVNRDTGSDKYLEIRKRDDFPISSAYTVSARRRIVSEQVGARVLWDAIRGQSFANIVDPELIVGFDKAQCAQLKARLGGFESRLRDKRPILIGHNMLYDLCFLRSNFVGDLPEAIEDFRAVTRSELPLIVDTKYLFTRGGDEMSPDYSLEQYFAHMKKEQVPRVMSSPPHSYSGPRNHQAGYDSYMTAIVFLKKSHQLAQTGERLWHIASDDLGEEVATSMTTPNLLEDCHRDTVAALARWSIREPQRPTTAPPTAPRTPKHESPSPSPGPFKVPGTIPEWGGRFWDKYGNRTRVGQFGLVLYMPKMAGEKE